MPTFHKQTLAFTIVLTSVLATAGLASAGTSGATLTAYPLYCQGRIDADRSGSFVWTTTIAKNAPPGAGHCSWADRVARGNEIHAGPSGDYGLLCPTGAFASAVRQYTTGQYFLVNVASFAMTNAGHRDTCLTATASPIALTPENRPWPVEKKPGDGPKQADTH